MIKALATALMLAASTAVHAADFSVSPSGKAIGMVGMIRPGDTAKLVTVHALASAKYGTSPRMIFLHSPGGPVSEALSLARTVKSLGLATVVGIDSKCHSMCVTVFAAGDVRVLSRRGEIGVHSISQLIDGEYIETDESRVVMNHVSRVMAGYGTPKIVISKMTSTPANKIGVIAANDVPEWVKIID